MIYEFIDAEKALFAINKACKTFGVSKSGFYAWKSKPETKRDQEDRVLKVSIKNPMKKVEEFIEVREFLRN